MIKSLADELSDILDWNENPGLGATAVEDARMGLIIFCRGLVCGLRAADAHSKEECPIPHDEDSVSKAFRRAMEKDTSLQQKVKEEDERLQKRMERAALRKRVEEERCRRYDENSQLRPVDECNIPMMGTPLEERLKDS